MCHVREKLSRHLNIESGVWGSESSRKVVKWAILRLNLKKTLKFVWCENFTYTISIILQKEKRDDSLS